MWGPLEALEVLGPQIRFTQGLLDTPKTLISSQIQNSNTHVFISIDIAYRLKRTLSHTVVTGMHMARILYTKILLLEATTVGNEPPSDSSISKVSMQVSAYFHVCASCCVCDMLCRCACVRACVLYLCVCVCLCVSVRFKLTVIENSCALIELPRWVVLLEPYSC